MSTVPGPSTIPPSMVVRDTLTDMLGRDVKVAPSDPWAPSISDRGAVAVYMDDGNRIRALISCNLELSVALGASLALIPAKVAASSVEEGRMTEDLAENLYEVLNILAAMFNTPNAPHVKLCTLYVPGGPPPLADVSAQLKTFGRRSDLKLDVAGYGGGRLSLVLV